MEDDTQSARGGPGPGRWMRVLLVVSLALNLLVVGTIGGAMFNWSKWRSHHPPRLDMAAGPLTQALSREDRREIGRRMRQAYRDGGMPGIDMAAELQALVGDLKADPYDRSAVEKRLSRHRDVFHNRFELGQSLLLDRLSQMRPEERAAYADRLAEEVRNWGRHGHPRRDRE